METFSELLEEAGFGLYEGKFVPLEQPMIEYLEEEIDKPLNKPMRGGSKKFYVYVKDPKTGNVKKISFGDTTGLSVKFNDPEARKSFVARHECELQKDKMSAAYWACRTPMYAKSLGLKGGGQFFW